MTIGARISFILLIYGLLVAHAMADTNVIEAVFKKLASQPRHDMRYTENKHSGFLDEAIVLTGILRYLPPDTIVREQYSPQKLRFEITGDVVTMQRNGETTTIKLDTVPSLQVFINSFRAILYGDLARLKSYYKITFSGKLSSWKISLQPRSTMLALVLESMTFYGAFGSIAKIDIRENEEDWSEMRLQAVSQK